jgi:hypothetical protein
MSDLGMNDITDDPALVKMLDYWNDSLDHYRRRVGAYAFDIIDEEMGREAVETFWRDGEQVGYEAPGFIVGSHNKWAYRVFGRTWFTARLHVPATGRVGLPVCEYERPPEAVRLRTPGHYVRELTVRPRPPALVPGWMKVELAAVGAWDLVTDTPAWVDYQSTGTPQTPQTAGVPPPPGAQWALPAQVTPIVIEHRNPEPGPEPGNPARQPGWAVPARVLDPGPMTAIRARWETMARQWSPLVRVLAPGAGIAGGEEAIAIAPALAGIAAVFPGVDFGPVDFTWPQSIRQVWWEQGFENRYAHQPLWAGADGHEAIVVRIDPGTGAPGEVVYLRDGARLDTLAPDIITWWETFTTWAEEELTRLVDVKHHLAAQDQYTVQDADHLTELLANTLDEDFTEWLDNTTTSR